MFRAWLDKKLEGYVRKEPITTESALKHIQNIEDMQEKHRVLTQAVKRLFNAIDSDDILRVREDGQWMFEGRPLLREEVEAIKKSAQNFTESRMWKILESELKYQANLRMFSDSKTVEDMIAGKVLLYFIDIVKTRLKRM